MAKDCRESVTCDDESLHELCHPEDMRRSTLISILNERQLDIPNLEGMDYVQLIELYNSFVLPFPQRIQNKRKAIKMETDQLSSSFKRKALISDHNHLKRMRHEADEIKTTQIVTENV